MIATSYCQHENDRSHQATTEQKTQQERTSPMLPWQSHLRKWTVFKPSTGQEQDAKDGAGIQDIGERGAKGVLEKCAGEYVQQCLEQDGQDSNRCDFHHHLNKCK